MASVTHLTGVSYRSREFTLSVSDLLHDDVCIDCGSHPDGILGVTVVTEGVRVSAVSQRSLVFLPPPQDGMCECGGCHFQ